MIICWRGFRVAGRPLFFYDLFDLHSPCWQQSFTNAVAAQVVTQTAIAFVHFWQLGICCLLGRKTSTTHCFYKNLWILISLSYPWQEIYLSYGEIIGLLVCY
jgi:hypothetical protein